MKRRTLFALAAGPASLWALGSARAQPQPEPGTGRIERIEFTAPREVGARPVDVRLPADYSPLRRYQVLYMHDGQNLFDGRHAYGGKSWRADVALSRLVKAGRIADTIIVGVWNAGVERYAEYYPEKALTFAPEDAQRGAGTWMSPTTGAARPTPTCAFWSTSSSPPSTNVLPRGRGRRTPSSSAPAWAG